LPYDKLQTLTKGTNC